MISKRLICFLSLLECIQLAVGTFNLTSAHCDNPGQDFLLNQFKEWPAASADGSDGYCYDAKDDGYHLGESLLTCSGCLQFSCRSTPCEGRDGSLSKMFWELESVGSECCQTCDGTIVPPNKVVSAAQLGGECRVREVATCRTYPDGESGIPKGSIQVSYESDLCCPDKPSPSQGVMFPNTAWSSLDASYLDPETCSVRTCSSGSPAHWDSQIQYPGQCGCCVYNGKMFPHGEIVNGKTRQWCCEGRVVVGIEYKNSTSTTSTTTSTSTPSLTTTSTTTSSSTTFSISTTTTITTTTTTTTTTSTTTTTATTTTSTPTTPTKTTTTPTTTTTTITTTTSTTTTTTVTTTTTTTTTTTITTTTRNRTTTTSKIVTGGSRTNTTTTFIPPTVQSGHTLLRKIVVDTTTCDGCSEGSLTIQVWGADDAVVVHDCTTMPLTVTGVGKQGFERELGEYTETHGCREAPLDARVSDGTVIWEGKGKWEAKNICFEWLDEKKFPLDCKIFGDVIASCKTNRAYPGLKCPTS